MALRLGRDHFFFAPVTENARGILSLDCRVEPNPPPPKTGLQIAAHPLVSTTIESLVIARQLFQAEYYTLLFCTLKLLPGLNICGPTQIVAGQHKVEAQAHVTPICAEMVSACVATWLFQSISRMSPCLMQQARAAITPIPVLGLRFPGYGATWY